MTTLDIMADDHTVPAYFHLLGVNEWNVPFKLTSQWQGYLLTSTDRQLDKCLAHNCQLNQEQSYALTFSVKKQTQVCVQNPKLSEELQMFVVW